MAVDVSQIVKNDGATRLVDESFCLPEDSDKSVDVRFLSPVHVCGTVKNVDNILYLEAEAAVTIEALCARCLKPVTHDFRFPIREQFSASKTGEELVPLKNDEIDLAPLAEQFFYLALPIRFLCREDCKGLCPNCGQNLNEAACSCDNEEIDPRLAALKAFLPDS